MEVLFPMACKLGFPLAVSFGKRFGRPESTPLLDLVRFSDKFDRGYRLMVVMPPSVQGPNRHEDTSVADQQQDREAGELIDEARCSFALQDFAHDATAQRIGSKHEVFGPFNAFFEFVELLGIHGRFGESPTSCGISVPRNSDSLLKP